MKHCIIHQNGKLKLKPYHVLFAHEDIYAVCNWAIRNGKVFHDKSVFKLMVKGKLFYCTHDLDIKYGPSDFYLVSNFPDEQSALNFLKPVKKGMAVQCNEDGKRFNAMIDACIHYGIRADVLSRHLKAPHIYKTVKGLTFSRL